MSYWATIAGYLLLVGAGLAAWLYARARPQVLATLGSLVDRIMHHRNTRLGVILVWWWLGWHFFLTEV